ncbi:hypothetical protein ACJEQE_28200, partial [Klebsiella pneumoniae]
MLSTIKVKRTNTMKNVKLLAAAGMLSLVSFAS